MTSVLMHLQVHTARAFSECILPTHKVRNCRTHQRTCRRRPQQTLACSCLRVACSTFSRCGLLPFGSQVVNSESPDVHIGRFTPAGDSLVRPGGVRVG